MDWRFLSRHALRVVSLIALIACSSAQGTGSESDGGQDAQVSHACVFEKRVLSCDGHVGDWQSGICVDGECSIAAHSDNCQPNTVDPSCVDFYECRNMTAIDVSCAEWESQRDGAAGDGSSPVGPPRDASAQDSAAPSVDASSPSADAGATDGGGPVSEGGPSPGH
jgi:hypothetical protein